MKRRASIIILASALALSLLLSACGKKTVAESPAPSASPTQSADSIYPLIVKAGSSVSVDLNGDGSSDEVSFQASEDAATILHLSVNGVDYAGSVYDEGFFTDMLESAYYCITDIDTSDSSLEIAIMDYGPSDDYITDFFRFDGTDLKYIGCVSGMIVSSLSDRSDLTFVGNGTISSYMRLSVLQTWFAKADWRLSKTEGFEPVAQALYYPNSTNGCDLTTNVEIPVYSNNSISSEKSLIPAGTALTLIATDNISWVLAKNSEGKECWIHLEGEYGQSVETASGSDYPPNVFSGLLIAD